MTLTVERLKGVLSYDPETGVFRWLVLRGRGAAIGQIAGSVRKKCGYRQIRIDQRTYFAHRLAWLYMTGSWPKDQIDHRNVVPDDNRWSNLREADPVQNRGNIRAQRAGLKGVTLVKQRRKYQAQIHTNSLTIFLGLFDTEQEAHEAYMRAAYEKYGEFARAV